jgi:hypothetical protein
MERFNVKKVNKVEGKGQYRVEISNRFAALEVDCFNTDFYRKSSVLWDIMPCSLTKVTDIAEEHVASMFRVKE